MGLSIHYSGSFNPSSSLTEMIEEVKEFAETMKWKHYVLDDCFPEKFYEGDDIDKNLYGICFAPPESETVSICFLSNGRMSSPLNLAAWGNSNEGIENGCLYMVAVKTQYAGPEVHIQIIKLLKYLEKKYFIDFTVSDEGHYWETGDENLLRETFRKYNDYIDSFAFGLENFPKNEGENLEDFIVRIAEDVRKRNGGKE